MDEVSFSMMGSNQPVNGVLSFFDSSIIFVPDAPLTYGELYTVSFVTRGGSIASRSWTFKVMEDPDAFTVAAVDFQGDQHAVATDAFLELTLTMPIDLSASPSPRVGLEDSQGKEVLSYWYLSSPRTLVIAPAFPLRHEESYTLRFFGDLRSESGKSLTLQEPITFTTAADLSAPQILWTSPYDGSFSAPFDGSIALIFSEPLDPATVTPEVFRLSNADRTQSVPIAIHYNPLGTEVTLVPEAPLAYLTPFQVEVGTGLRDLNGNALAAPYIFSFTSSSDNSDPRVIAVTPGDGATGVTTDTSITIEFSEAIDPASVADNSYLLLDTGSYYGTSVLNRVSVNDRFLTITPTEPLQHEVKYLINLDNNYFQPIRDLSGSSLTGTQRFSFTTQPFSNAINVGMAIDAFTYDGASNTLFAINKANRKLLLIDLSTQTLTKSINLTYRSSDLCYQAVGNRLFLVNDNTTFISEIDLATLTESHPISWDAQRWGDGTTPTPFEIECTDESLLVVDGQWSPVLWKIDLVPPYTPVEQTTVSNVGGITLSADASTLYTWYQYGWSAGSAGSHVRRYDLSQTGYAFVEQSNTGYPQHNRDPLDAPIFYDEQNQRVINKQYVFNALNLNQIFNQFDGNEAVYAVDWSRNRAASKSHIYSLTDYSSLTTLPIVGANGLFFDKDGNLYMIKNSNSKIYYISEADIDRN
jgi:Bacterial Ig-like domain